MSSINPENRILTHRHLFYSGNVNSETPGGGDSDNTLLDWGDVLGDCAIDNSCCSHTTQNMVGYRDDSQAHAWPCAQRLLAHMMRCIIMQLSTCDYVNNHLALPNRLSNKQSFQDGVSTKGTTLCHLHELSLVQNNHQQSHRHTM